MNPRLKLIGLFVAVTLVASACAKSGTGPAESVQVIQAGQKVKIALILPDSKSDMSWSQGMYEGVMAFQKELGETQVQVQVSENLSRSSEAGAAIRDYAARKFDLIIAHSSQFQTTVLDIAKEFPEIAFAYGAGSQAALNVYAYDPQAQMGAYVMGIVAATLTRSKIVGIVGPAQTGDALKYNIGFKAGVAVTNPNIKVLETYTGASSNTSKAKELARSYVERGADLLTGTGPQTVGAIQAAAEKPGIYWLASDVDQSSLAPNTVLMAQAYQWKDLVKTIVDNRAKGVKGGQVLTLDFANGRIKLVINPRLADKIPADLETKIEQAQKDIASSKITVPLPPK